MYTKKAAPRKSLTHTADKLTFKINSTEISCGKESENWMDKREEEVPFDHFQHRACQQRTRRHASHYLPEIPIRSWVEPRQW